MLAYWQPSGKLVVHTPCQTPSPLQEQLAKILAVKGLLNAHPHPTEEQARDYLSGNLCRCGTYKEVLAVVADLTQK